MCPDLENAANSITEFFLEHSDDNFNEAPFVIKSYKTTIELIQENVDCAIYPNQTVKRGECL